MHPEREQQFRGSQRSPQEGAVPRVELSAPLHAPYLDLLPADDERCQQDVAELLQQSPHERAKSLLDQGISTQNLIWNLASDEFVAEATGVPLEQVPTERVRRAQARIRHVAREMSTWPAEQQQALAVQG